MKTKTLLAVCTALLMVACSQKQSVVQVPVSTIDVEQLNGDIDYNMDVTGLSLGDLRVLRHAPAARQGFPFKDAYLRGVYETTTWYDSLVWKFDESVDFSSVKERGDESWRDYYYRASEEVGAVKYTAEEQSFMERLKTREDELRKQNFNVADGLRVNVANLVNPAQLSDFDPLLCQQLAQNGFAIVPGENEQLFHVYEQNDYRQFPSFVTTDLFLQLYHLYFDCMLRELEEQKLDSLLRLFCHESLRAFTVKQYDQDGGLDTLAAMTWLNTYFTVANALIHEKEPVGNADAQHEYRQVMKSEDDISSSCHFDGLSVLHFRTVQISVCRNQCRSRILSACPFRHIQETAQCACLCVKFDSGNLHRALSCHEAVCQETSHPNEKYGDHQPDYDSCC